MLMRRTRASEYGSTMPEHGHEVCPHCDAGLEGAEATCPGCSGPLFGIAPKSAPSTQSGTTTIGDVSVPTYTPPATDELVPQSTGVVSDLSLIHI